MNKLISGIYYKNNTSSKNKSRPFQLKNKKLKTPFIISFKKKLINVDKEEIIDLFLVNIKGTLYKEIEKKNENKVIISGDFHSFQPNKRVPWNLWTGFSKKAELHFIEDNVLVYSIDYTYGVIPLILGMIILLTFSIIYSFEDFLFFRFLVFFELFITLNLIIKIIRHKQIFNQTIRLENKYKGKYDWANILKDKTNNELKRISKGNTTLTLEIQKLAKEELIRRNRK